MKPVGRVFLWLGVAIGIVLLVALAVRRFREATFYPGVIGVAGSDLPIDQRQRDAAG